MDTKLTPLSEQVIVITGASSGIGLVTAQLAVARGARVVAAARSAEDLAELARTAGPGKVAVAVADVADRRQVEAIARTAIERFGRIDTWVNNAGVSIYGRIEEISEADNRRLFDTNFWGVVNGSLTALPHLKARGGALINVGSEVSDAVVPLQGMYSASKHAVKGFTDALRIELDSDRAPVSVTLIQPTAVDTPYPQHARNYLPNEPKLPTPMIDPQQVAEAILKAAEHGGRDVKVGLMATVNTLVSSVAPAVGDLMAKRQMNRQERDLPPQDPAGGLHEARGGGRTHGLPDDTAETTVRR